MIWHRLDAFLTRIRPHRQALSLLIDGIIVAAAWNATYPFRLGFERWWSARPGYDLAVMLALVALYLLVLVALKVPRSMWRFSGFGEVQRLTLACAVAGVAAISNLPRISRSERAYSSASVFFQSASLTRLLRAGLSSSSDCAGG